MVRTRRSRPGGIGGAETFIDSLVFGLERTKSEWLRDAEILLGPKEFCEIVGNINLLLLQPF